MDNFQIQILHVDDDPGLLDLTGEFLEREDDRFRFETATNADDGLDRFRDHPPDCIVSDYDMPGRNGIEFLQAVRETHPDLPFILYTGKGSESVASDAMAAGVTDYLQKDAGTEQYELLANRIRNAVQAHRATQEVARQEELMRLTELAGDTGGWELDLETDELLLTEGTQRLTGLPPEGTLTLERAVDMYHPDDRDDIWAAVNKAIQTVEQTNGMWRLQPRDSENERLVDVTITPVTSNGDVTTLRGAINDVTDLRKRQRELNSERRFIEQSLNALEDLFYVLNTDGTIRRWNDRALDVTGYTETELDGIDATDIFPDDEQEGISDAIGQTLSGGHATVEADVLTADGDRIPYEWTSARLTDDNGETTGIVGIGRDLSERRQRERRFQALVEESSDIISIVDADGRLKYQSPSIEDILGYDPDETVGYTAWEYVHPDDREGIRETFEEWKTNSEASESVEYRARHADGSWRWLEARGSEQFDTPAVDGYVINSRDITEQKNRDQHLEEYETVLKALNNAVYVLDKDGRFTYVNDEFVELVGYERDTIIGNTPSLIKSQETVELAERQLGRLLSEDGPETVTFETMIEPRDGDPIVCEDHMRVLPYEGDSFNGSVGTLQDVTERQERTRELKRQNERLEEFTGVVSHDLRNPLRTAAGRLELAQTECDSTHLDGVANALERSQALIDDLLTLARGGDAVGSTEPVSVSALAQECWEVIPDEEAQLTVETDRTVLADRSRLRQLLENLFGNAVKHGGEDVTVRIGDLSEGIYVADDGVGISPKEREDIFETGYSTAEKGTGFGLRIVKQVVDAHGWEIQITDSDGGGARIEITKVETPPSEKRARH